MAISKRPWRDSDNAARRSRALLELGTVGLIGALALGLVFSFSFSIFGGLIISGLSFLAMREEYRFQIPENTSGLVVGLHSQLQVGQGGYWKHRSETISADNVTSTGLRPAIELREAVEGIDEGNRVQFVGALGFVVKDTIAFNILGSEGQAVSTISRRVQSDFKDFCFEEMRTGDKLKVTDEVILSEKTTRTEFIEHFKGLEATYLRDYGIGISWANTLLDNVDYDDDTKQARRDRASAVRAAHAERERQNIITNGVKDARLALAADKGSQDVKVEAFELDIHVHGDSAVAGALAQAVNNPAIIGAATTAARSKGGK